MLGTRLFLAILISILLVGSSLTIWALAKDDEEEKVPLSDVPASVIEAANKAVPGGEITAVERDVEDGGVIYDVEKVVDGVNYEIEITEQGVVQEIEKEDKNADDDEDDDKEEEYEGEDDDQDEIDLSDVPVRVLRAARRAVPNARVMEVEMEDENGKMVYEVGMVIKYEVKVTAKGKVKEIKIEVQDDDDKEDEDEEDDD